MNEPKRPKHSEETLKQTMTGRQTYNLVTDTVVGPNVRWKDNLFQGLAVFVCLVLGVGVGLIAATDRLVGALWISGRGNDVGERKGVDIRVSGRYARVTAADSMNGTRQELVSRFADGFTCVDRLLAGDYAVLVEFWKR